MLPPTYILYIRHIRRFLPAAAALLILLLLRLWPFSGEALAVEVGGLSFQVNLGFGGYFRPGSYVPVKVEIANEGFPVEAAVEVVVHTGYRYPADTNRYIYRQEVALPTGARKRLDINVPLTDIYRPLDVRLVQKDGAVLGATRLSLRDVGVSSDIVLVLDPTGEKWTWLQEPAFSALGTSRRSRVYVIHARSERDLPNDWVAYESIRTVVLTDAFPVAALSVGQLEALLSWVEAGGHLVVAGGPGLEAYRSPLLRAVLPVALTGSTEIITVTDLGSDYSPFSPPRELVVWQALPPPAAGAGRISQSIDDLPLLAYRWYGTGRVTYVGFDPSQAALRDWPDLDRFSREIIFPARVVHQVATRSLEQGLLPLLLSQTIPYPRHIWLFLFLTVYGAGFLLWLWLAGRHLWSWAAMAVWLGLAAATAWLAFGPQARAALRAYVEVRVTRVPPAAGKAHSFAIAQVMDMHGGYWTVARKPGEYMAPVTASGSETPALLFIEQKEAEVVIGPTTARRPQALASHALLDLPVEVEISRYNFDYEVRLHNGTPWPLKGAFFIDRQRYVSLGGAAPGETLVTRFPAERFITATENLSPDWIAASVGAVARRADSTLERPELQALSRIVSYALTPGETSYLPWGAPLIIALLDAPVDPPLRSDYTGSGYHFVVVPLAGILREDTYL